MIVLDVAGGGPGDPAVRRLVHEAAGRAFAAMHGAREVEVRALDGTVLGRSSRFAPEPPAMWFPDFLREPRRPRHHGPDLSSHLGEDEPLIVRRPKPSIEHPAPHAPGQFPAERPPPIADRFDLSPAIRAAIRDPDDPVHVIRAILEAGGRTVQAERDNLLVDGLALVVVPDGGGHEALNHAYRRIAATGAARGLVVVLGHVDPQEVRRRELLDPRVLHTGLTGVQRMADAAALGGDPLRFAVAPAVALKGASAFHTTREAA